MKYFIGYLIQGDVARWHVQTAKDISEKFNTWKIHEKIPPHITIFRPFDVEDISSIKDLLSEWTAGSTASRFSLIDFGHFDKRVIFAKVITSEPVIGAVSSLQKKIEVANINPAKDYPSDWHPHATLANHIDSSVFKEIWSYILTLPKPNLSLPFDNLTIFYSTGNRGWEVGDYFPIKTNQ